MKRLFTMLLLCASLTSILAQNPSVPGYKSTTKPKKANKQKKADKKKKAEKRQQSDKKKKVAKPKKVIEQKPTQTKETIEPKQIENKEFLVEDKLTKIDLVGFQFEKSYNTKHTLAFGLYSNFIFPYFENSSLRFTTGLMPKIELSNRFYYNMEKRKKHGEPYENNSGPYVAGKVEVQTLFIGFQPGFDEYNAAAVGIVWGLQNNNHPFTLNFEVGLGYGLVKINAPASYYNGNGLVILGKLNFGFLLGKH